MFQHAAGRRRFLVSAPALAFSLQAHQADAIPYGFTDCKQHSDCANLQLKSGDVGGFIPMHSNAAARAKALRLAQSSNPGSLLVLGGSGSGKSNLLSAVSAIVRNRSPASVLRVDARRAWLLQALSDSAPLPDLLLIDDVDRLASLDGFPSGTLQAVAFRLRQDGKQCIATASSRKRLAGHAGFPFNTVCAFKDPSRADAGLYVRSQCRRWGVALSQARTAAIIDSARGNWRETNAAILMSASQVNA